MMTHSAAILRHRRALFLALTLTKTYTDLVELGILLVSCRGIVAIIPASARCWHGVEGVQQSTKPSDPQAKSASL